MVHIQHCWGSLNIGEKLFHRAIISNVKSHSWNLQTGIVWWLKSGSMPSLSDWTLGGRGISKKILILYIFPECWESLDFKIHYLSPIKGKFDGRVTETSFLGAMNSEFWLSIFVVILPGIRWIFLGSLKFRIRKSSELLSSFLSKKAPSD